MRNSPILSIIIVNWNVKHLLSACIKSIYQYYSTDNFEIIVIDNHSSDGSIKYISDRYSKIKLFENKKNLGFARANNQGICQSDSRYLLLLNSDTLWIDDSLHRMIEFMEKNPKVGAIGPRLLNSDRQSIQYWCARRLPHPIDSFLEFSKLNLLFPDSNLSRRHLISDWDHKSDRKVECLSGACMLIRRETIQEVGLLDEGYPLYFEDTDLCHRIGSRQWELYYYAKAQLVHFGQQSSMQNHGPATIKSVKGIYRYYHKFYGLRASLLAWALIFPSAILKIIAWFFLGVLRADIRTEAIGQVKAYIRVCGLKPNTGEFSRIETICGNK